MLTPDVAYGVGVERGDLEELVALGADALCIGRPIVDAPLLEMPLVIEAVSVR